METKNSVETLKDLVVLNLIEFFSGDENYRRDKDRMIDVNMALKSFKAASTLIATERVKDATQFSIIKTITTNEKERTRYIQATLPGYVPKLLKDK